MSVLVEPSLTTPESQIFVHLSLRCHCHLYARHAHPETIYGWLINRNAVSYKYSFNHMTGTPFHRITFWGIPAELVNDIYQEAIARSEHDVGCIDSKLLIRFWQCSRYLPQKVKFSLLIWKVFDAK